MSRGQSLMHITQSQRDQLRTDPNSNFYQQPRIPPQYPNSNPYGLHADTHSPPMDASHFEDFSFPYASLPEHSPMMAIPDHGGMGFDDSSANAFAHHQAMAAMSAPRVVSFNSGSDRGRGSMDMSEDDIHDRNSPLTNSLDDGVPDEFGLPGQGRQDGTDLGGKAKDNKSRAPPAWSELKTKAGKDRKRLPLACIACRRKKIRCSGEKPACKHCLRSRIPCVYKVTTRKAAPRTDYMAMLDKRLKRMEERIIKVVPKAEQDTTSPVTRAVVKPTIPGTQQSGKNSSKKRGAEEAFGSDLEAWATAPSKTQGADQRRKSLEADEAEENQLFREGVEALPSKDIQEHLAEVFFDNVYGQAYHLLHKPSYIRKLKNNALPPVLVLSVCAVAARFTENPKLTSSATRQFLRGEEWASHARDICTRRYEWPNITILTCLLILGLHEFGTCHGGRSWALGGQAIRMAFALQLHKDLEYDPMSRNGRTKLSFIDREIRRRIMWGCFLMDRFNSSSADRPMFVQEDSVKIPLPVKERLFQLDMPAETEYLDGQVRSCESAEDGQVVEIEARENMGVAAYTIRSIALWGRIIAYLNQGGRELDSHPMWSDESDYAQIVQDAESLSETLPDSLQYSRENLEVQVTETTGSQFALLHISIQQNIIYLNQAAVTFSNEGTDEVPSADFLAQARSKSFVAASRISEFLKDAEEVQCYVSAPFAGYCAFSSATIHISGIFSGDCELKTVSEANASVNIKFLRKMMRHWGMFHWMVENIRMQYRDALVVARSGAVNSGAKTSPILQYADWFNRYPHGVLDTDLIDMATQLQRKTEKGEDAVLEQKPELQSVEEFFSTLSPSQSSDTRDGSQIAPAKRKAMAKKQAEPPARPDRKQHETQGHVKASRPEQVGIRPQIHRRFSGAHGAPVRPHPYNAALLAHSQDPSYHNVAAMRSASVPQFANDPSNQRPFFSADMLLVNLAQQPNNLAHPQDRQVLFDGYSMESDNMPNHHMNDRVASWNGIPPNAQGDAQGHDQRGVKGMRIPNRSVQGQRQQIVPGSINNYGDSDNSMAWFMPFDIEPPPTNQELDALAMFGGGIASNPLDGLQHCL